MRVRATKAVVYEIRISRQREHDPDDGTGPGFYAWVGPPDDQSDFAVGPFKTMADARVGACERLRRMGYQVEEARRA
jgi:hypothetical protein